MDLLVGYAVALMLAVLVSALAARTVLSTAVLFLAAGVLIQGVGIVPESPESVVETVAELALFSVLFTDGIADARNREGVRFGEEPVHEPVGPPGLTSKITNALAAFVLLLQIGRQLVSLSAADPRAFR